MAASAPTNLRCEYLVNPLGLDETQPRLSWEIQDPRRGARQTAYQVIVRASDGPAQVLWDSGKVASDHSIHVVYQGPALRSRQRCAWQVRTWDDGGQASPWSETAWWEMGLLECQEWAGQWIGGRLAGGKRTSVTCPFLRTAFTLNKPVARARLYVTALGLYEFHLNGARVGDDVFCPGWTDYRKRVQYQVYDVTALVRPGENAAGAMLGDGWYCGHVGDRGRQLYGDRPRLLAQVMLDFADGTTQTIATDGTWQHAYGPLLEADLIMGESYDARLEMTGWDEPGFDAAKWLAAEVFPDGGALLAARPGPAVRRQEELKPIAPPRMLSGWHPRWLFDFGQNMVGRVRLKISGEAGTTVVLRHGEMLHANGWLYTDNLRSARQTDCYTLRGGGEEIWEPRFTFHGFRYVELSGCPGAVTADMLTGVVLHSELPPTGIFECSDPLINQLQHNIVWGQKGNFVDVPTDCPQRDERLGWTGDAQVFARTAAFNTNAAAFFTKWVQDVADAESGSGEIPMVIPNNGIGGDGGPAWADAAVICPWTIYLCYADERLLEKHYPLLARFIEKLAADSRNLIRAYDGCKWQGFGDWLSINAETPNDLIGTAFFAYSTRLVARMARILGKADDAAKYEQLFERIRAAFVKRFVTSEGLVAGLTQTGYVLALHFELLPADLRPAAVAGLVRDIEKRGTHLSTGFVGSSYLPHVLSDAGRLDTAYALLNQKTWPSWLYPVTQGATTIWERWDGWTQDKGFQDPGMNSFNHYAYGAIGAWLYAVVAGIELDPERPGGKHIIIRPRPGGGLTRARATLVSPYGLIESGWRIEDATLRLDVTIPSNTAATIHVPAENVEKITENGVPLSRAEGLKVSGAREGAVVVEAGAGRYSFAAPIRPR